MYEGWVSFGGVEVINNERARTLAQAAGAPWFKGRRYPTVQTAVDPASPYSDPTTAPWYDPDLAEVSSRFFGVFGLDLAGIHESTKTAEVTQNAGNGGVIGAPRKGTRAVRARVFILARGRDALEYGRTWLAALLDTQGCAQSEDCGRADVRFFSTVPETEYQPNSLSRYLKRASVVSGPFTVDQTESRGVYGEGLEWSWASESAFVFSQPRPVTLDISPDLSLIQDIPINWMPMPSAELEENISGYTRPVVARNLMLNPSFDAGATGWTSVTTAVSGSDPAPFLFGGDRASPVSGTAYLVGLNGNTSTVASGTARITMLNSPAVVLTGVPTDGLMQASVYCSAALMAGGFGAIVQEFCGFQFLDASNAQIAYIPMPRLPNMPGVFQSPVVAKPAGATKALIGVGIDFTWSSGNPSLLLNTSARVITDAVTITHFGSV